MNKFLKLLQDNKHIMLDGAMGTMLFEAGLVSGASPEAWNISNPDKIRVVHKKYIEAGSNIILTNSFGGTAYRLKLHGLETKVYELNFAAAKIARSEADIAMRNIVVGGSMGPTGELLSPLGMMTFDEAKAAFAVQAKALAEGGVDVLWIETMSDLNEAAAAIEGARTATDLPVVVTMTFDTNGHTMMGVSPKTAIETLSKYDLAAIGANCGNGPGEIEFVIQTMYSLRPDIPLVAKSNAGIPHWVNDVLSYDGTPDVMAEHVSRVLGLGARLIGGCCGNTPDHVSAMAAALRSGESVLPDFVASSPSDSFSVRKEKSLKRIRKHQRS